jgi:mannosyltransferase
VRWWIVVLVGVFASTIGMAFSWVPSLWDDEAATVISATRSFESLARMVQTVDLVHAAYYAVLHLWFDVVGFSPFTLRLPSALAIGGAAALMVVLVSHVAVMRVAIVAGIVLALLPRTTWAAVEGRSYAITMLLAVAMTWLLVVALEQGHRRSRFAWWALYAVVCALSVVVFAYLALVIVGHAITIGILAIVRRIDRAALIAFVVSTAAVLGATATYLLAMTRQVGQVSWVPPIGQATVGNVLVGQFFMENRAAAVACGLAVVVGVTVLVRGIRAAPPRAQHPPRAQPLEYVAIFLPLLVVPPLVVVLVSVVLDPLYIDRYFTFCAPALAAFVAVAVGALNRPLATAGLLALAALVAPSYVGQRSAEAHDASPWLPVAQRIAAGDPVGRVGAAFEIDDSHGGIPLGAIAIVYPGLFTGISDVTLAKSAEDAAGVWPEEDPVTSADLVDLDAVWLVATDARQSSRDEALIESSGFTEASRERIGYVELLLYVR